MNLRVAAPVLSIALSLTPTFVRAASLQLQGLCASQARAAFRSGGWETQPLAGFINHYDENSNKCFIAILSTTNSGETILRNTIVFDANEGTTYATYAWHSMPNKKYWEVSPVDCSVTTLTGEEVQCHSNDEFDQLIHGNFGVTLK
jgi:hypothetical protein